MQKSSTTIDPVALRAVLPAMMLEARRWLLWRCEKKNKYKFDKVPYYVSGERRSGTLDAPEDVARLATLDEAVAAFNRGGFYGLGFALGDGWHGIDLDDHRKPETGELTKLAARIVDECCSYTEASPFGHGLHIVGHGAPFAAVTKTGQRIEAYASGRFFTVTGHALHNAGELADLQPVVERLRTKFVRANNVKHTAGPHADVPDETLRDLRSALGAIPSDDRGAWVRIGHALATLGDAGRALWFEWSQASEKFDAADAGRVWGSLKPSNIDHKAVFAEAQQHGWQNPNKRQTEPTAPIETAALSDFHAFMPLHQYIFAPTRELWPASSVDKRIAEWPINAKGEPVPPSVWLDRHRPVDQMTWQPGLPELVFDKVVQVGGWTAHHGARVFNLYRPPAMVTGDPKKAAPWIDHVVKVYADNADHIIQWLAHRVQRPGEKVNHALVLGGAQGTGKDTLLEPIKAGVGPWNWQEITPKQMLGRFNGWVKAVIVRVSEARDLGDVDRFTFYDHSKVYLAAPPDVLRVDEKNLREHYVANVLGMVITTNHATDGLYLPADDRRHFVAWSTLTRQDFTADYWTRVYGWYGNGGIGHVVAYLRELDLSGVDWKAPPQQTPAFWNIVATGEAPEAGELRDVIEAMGNPPVLVLAQVIDRSMAMNLGGLAEELRDRKNRRAVPHRFDRVGYVPVRNPDAADGLFKINDRRVVVYAARTLPLADQVREARRVQRMKSVQSVVRYPHPYACARPL